MDKLAAYEMLLADHPLWNKEARAIPVNPVVSSAVKKFKEGRRIAGDILNARTPAEAALARRQAGSFAITNPQQARLVNLNPEKMGRHTHGPILDDMYPRYGKGRFTGDKRRQLQAKLRGPVL